MKKKKLLSLILIWMLMIMLILPAQSPLYAAGTTTLDVSDTMNMPDNVTFSNGVFTIDSAAVPIITVTGTTNENIISVANGVAGLTLILNGASITSLPGGRSAIEMEANTNITIQLANGTTNTLAANNANNVAGLSVPTTATVTINGSGSLAATGGRWGAGIGSGSGTPCGTININDGIVTAIGGQYGAGIGSGNVGAGGTINISGGIITATGGQNGAGIGAGRAGTGGTVNISAGTVTATGGQGDAGIGGGTFSANGIVNITGNPIIMAASDGNKPAIYAASGNGNVINATLNSAISTSPTYLKCNDNTLTLPGNYKNFAFSAAADSAVSVYSDPIYTTLLGMIMTNPAGLTSIPTIDLSTNAAGTTPVLINIATIAVRKNGSAWTTDTPAIQLSTSNTELQDVISATASNGVYTFTGIAPATTYYVWDTTSTAQYTNQSVTLTSSNAVLNYYTVQFAAANAGTATGSTISATYNASPISSGADVLSGKQLVITTAGQGASSYTYAWSGAGTSGQTTAALTIAALSAAVNATCTVTGAPASTTINLGDNSGTNLPIGVTYDSADHLFTIGAGAGGSEITITGTTNTNKVSVNGVAVNITLSNADIQIPSTDPNNAFTLSNGANVMLTLTGNNTLKGNANGYGGLGVPNGQAITIQGTGTLNAEADSNAAGIGGYYQNYQCGTVNIISGTVNAIGGSGGGAGIGGTNGGNGGIINISGGMVTATGLDGAGIGGGRGGDGGNVNIFGGTVIASGILWSSGIGGGLGGDAGTISIIGGVVMAIGGNYGGAGIGSGLNGGGGDITIGSTPVIIAASTSSNPAINVESGNGSVINAKLDAAISTEAVTYLKCNGNVLPLPANYLNFAFSAAADSPISAYSNSGCTVLLGNIVTKPAGSPSIPIVDLSINPANTASVRLHTATITVNKDGVAWASNPSEIQLSESNTVLQGAVTGTCSNGVYSFRAVDAIKIYYVWDTTNNKYTGQSVTSGSPDTSVDYYTVTLSSTAGITSISGSGTYLSGSDVPISAVVGSGYNWSKWVLNANGNLVSSANAYTITGISSAQSYKAVAAVDNSPRISTASLPDGTVGTAYSQALAAVFAGPPPTWSISAGALPAGLTLNTGTGAISGTPTTTGTNTFTVQAANINGIGSKTYTVVITAPATYRLTITAGSGGTASTGGTYVGGASIGITATPNSSYSFSGWTSSNGGSFANASSANTTFTMPANNTTVTASFSHNGGGGGSRDEDSAPVSVKPAVLPVHVPIIVDNKEYYIGSVAVNNNTATITVDQSEFDKQLANAKHSVVVPVTSDANAIVAQLVVKNVQDMNDKGVPLMVQTGNVSYNIPAASIDTKSVLSALEAADPSLAPVSIRINTNMEQSVQAFVNSAVLSAESKVVVPPVQFEVTAAYKDKVYRVEYFDRFVSRSVAITPEQARQITTAVVVNPDGTMRHVPTFVYQKEGKWYAQINSLTNSTYVLIFNQTSFTDTAGKWYQGAAEEMGSRKVINGVGSNCFAGDRDITRAEFAAMIVRALGLPASGNAEFEDVPSKAWYSEAVATASRYGIISGIGDYKFAPDAKITREEAMQMIYNASKRTPYEAVSGTDRTGYFSDYGTQAAWAAHAVDFNINNGFIQGFNRQINPKANLTRAEATTVVLRLLQKSGLVDVRT